MNGDSISDRTAWRESSLEQWRENVVKGEYSVLWAGCAKRTLWEKVTFPANRVSAGEDGYLMMDLFFRAESIALVPDVLYYHVDDRQNSVSNTRTCRYYLITISFGSIDIVSARTGIRNWLISVDRGRYLQRSKRIAWIGNYCN